MWTAVIREIDCVGCAKCLPACPVDAILGAPQRLHSVLTNECIGCGLCVAPCPMNCIEMVESSIKENKEEKLKRARHAKQRYQARQKRLTVEGQKKLPLPKDAAEKLTIRDAIAAAFNRIERKRKHYGPQEMR